MDNIALAEQELGKIGAILPGRAGYKSTTLSDMAPYPRSPRRGLRSVAIMWPIFDFFDPV